MAYNGTPHSRTHYSPNYLLFGQEIALPFDSALDIQETDHQEETLEEHVQQLQERLEEAYRVVSCNNDKAHRANQEYYDRRAKTPHYGIGDWVYLKSPAIKPGLSRKFYKPWSGPYQVTAKLSEQNYRLKLSSKKEVVVHADRMKCGPELNSHLDEKRGRPDEAPLRNREESELTDEESTWYEGELPMARDPNGGRSWEKEETPDSLPDSPSGLPRRDSKGTPEESLRTPGRTATGTGNNTPQGTPRREEDTDQWIPSWLQDNTSWAENSGDETTRSSGFETQDPMDETWLPTREEEQEGRRSARPRSPYGLRERRLQ